MKRTLKLRSIKSVIEFVGKSAQCIGEVKLNAGDSIVVDGKSLMSIFTLDLNKDLLLVYNESLDEEFDKYINKIVE